MTNRIKGIVYDILLFLATLNLKRRTTTKRALIIRVDEIGDYILWRKFRDDLAEAPVLKGCELHFCGNQSWKELYDLEPSSAFTHHIWLQKKHFKSSLKYRYFFLKNIHTARYSIVINTTYSRAKRVDDSLVKAAGAYKNIGMQRNNENYHSYEQNFDRKMYSLLFPEQTKPLFEFYRNLKFTEFITQKSPSAKNTYFNTNTITSAIQNLLPEKDFVVFPGSRSASRIWPASHFIEVSNYLYCHTGLTAVVCGAKNDQEYVSGFTGIYKNPFIDLSGKTSLTELLLVLKNAECLLSVDTGSVHMASSVQCPVFGIFNGSQYGRFAPYPKVLAPYFYAVYPDNVDNDIIDVEILRNKYEHIVSILQK